MCYAASSIRSFGFKLETPWFRPVGACADKNIWPVNCPQVLHFTQKKHQMTQVSPNLKSNLRRHPLIVSDDSKPASSLLALSQQKSYSNFTYNLATGSPSFKAVISADNRKRSVAHKCLQNMFLFYFGRCELAERECEVKQQNRTFLCGVSIASDTKHICERYYVPMPSP